MAYIRTAWNDKNATYSFVSNCFYFVYVQSNEKWSFFRIFNRLGCLDGQVDGTSQLRTSITSFLFIFGRRVLYDYLSGWNSTSKRSINKYGVRKSSSAHRSLFVTANFPSIFCWNLKWVPRLAHPHMLPSS